jgi:hypothetical protein
MQVTATRIISSHCRSRRSNGETGSASAAGEDDGDRGERQVRSLDFLKSCSSAAPQRARCGSAATTAIVCSCEVLRQIRAFTITETKV